LQKFNLQISNSILLFFFFTDGSDGWHQHEHGKGQHHHHQHHHHHHHHHQEQQKGGDHHLRQRRHEWSPSQAIHEKQSNVCPVHNKFSFFVTKIPKCFIIVYIFTFFTFLNFSSCLSSLAKCKNRTHGNENHATYFWYFGSFDEKRTYQNDMKSTVNFKSHKTNCNLR
jgi:hypothetical protein